MDIAQVLAQQAQTTAKNMIAANQAAQANAETEQSRQWRELMNQNRIDVVNQQRQLNMPYDTAGWWALQKYGYPSAGLDKEGKYNPTPSAEFNRNVEKSRNALWRQYANKGLAPTEFGNANGTGSTAYMDAWKGKYADIMNKELGQQYGSLMQLYGLGKNATSQLAQLYGQLGLTGSSNVGTPATTTPPPPPAPTGDVTNRGTEQPQMTFEQAYLKDPSYQAIFGQDPRMANIDPINVYGKDNINRMIFDYYTNRGQIPPTWVTNPYAQRTESPLNQMIMG